MPLWAMFGDPPPFDRGRPADAPSAGPLPAPPRPTAPQGAHAATTVAGRVIAGLNRAARTVAAAGDRVFDTMGATNAQRRVAARTANRAALETIRQRALALAGRPQPAAARRFGGELLDGAVSYPVGLGRAGDQVFDAIGATNAQAMADARRANGVLLDAIAQGAQQATTHPQQTLAALQQAGSVATDYTRDHPGRVLGRWGVSGALTLSKIHPGIVIGAGLTSIGGDVFHTIRNGQTTYDDVIQAILGGGPTYQPLGPSSNEIR